jgi:pyruvate dehydrogenase E1 component beta subunit
MKLMTYSQALREALIEKLEEDPNFFVIGEDIGIRGGVFGVTKDLVDQYPGRIIDTPISESAIAGAAYGGSITGCTVCAEIMYADFSFIAMDQIINSAAKSRYMFGGQACVPVVFRMSFGSGRHQAAQHSQCLEALFANIPGLKVIMPSTPNDAKGLLKSALTDNNPIIFLEHRMLYNTKGEVSDDCDGFIPIGVGDIKKKGDDITIIAIASMVNRVLEVSDILDEKGVSSEVIDPRTIKPLDKKIILDSVTKTGKLVIVHEAPLLYGIGGEIASMVTEECFDYLDAPIIRVGGKECPIPYNKDLEAQAIPTIEDIKAGINKIINVF